MIIDSQVHAYEANTPKRPWASVPNWPAHVTGDEMIAAMDKVGVDGAIFISAFSLYRFDGSYAAEVQRAHGNRLAIVKPLDAELIVQLAGNQSLLVSIEENAVIGGAGSEIERVLAERGITVPLLRLGLPDRFIDHGDQGQLLAELGLDKDGIVRAVRARVNTQ